MDVKVWLSPRQKFPLWQTVGKEASANALAISSYGNDIRGELRRGLYKVIPPEEWLRHLYLWEDQREERSEGCHRNSYSGDIFT